MNGCAVLEKGAVIRGRLCSVAGLVLEQSEIVVSLGIARVGCER